LIFEPFEFFAFWSAVAVFLVFVNFSQKWHDCERHVRWIWLTNSGKWFCTLCQAGVNQLATAESQSSCDSQGENLRSWGVWSGVGRRKRPVHRGLGKGR
jgi:hypothetical protein